MTASCVGRVERALKEVPGVTDAVVNLATERAAVSEAITLMMPAWSRPSRGGL